MSKELLKREIEIIGAFDKRNSDPKKNYGIHGMEMRFYLIGSLGAVQFIYFTGIHLPHVSKEFLNANNSQFNPFKGMGADIGYHSKTPMFEGQHKTDNCPLLSCDCYYDGSCLAAQEFEHKFIKGGSEAVWVRLEAEYESRFVND